MKKGFDASAYIKAQTGEIKKRVKKFKRLYLEFGGKLIHDTHATRVLPGYKKTTKIDLLKKLGKIKIIYCISAIDLESGRVISKKKRTYEEQALKNLKDLKRYGLNDEIIVITRFTGEKKALEFGEKLRKSGKRVYFHKDIKNYSKVSNAIKGFKNHPYIPIKNNLIILTGPASGSGKMSVALTQIYHEKRSGMKSAFAKFETFPIWNLPLEHPINLAYEAATADLQDKNLYDPYHKKYYKKEAVNYNRDIENYAILKEITKRITKSKFPYGYKSPTDMGVNEIKKGIIDDKACREAAIKEIKNRYKYYHSEFKKGRENKKTIKRIKSILKECCE